MKRQFVTGGVFFCWACGVLPLIATRGLSPFAESAEQKGTVPLAAADSKPADAKAAEPTAASTLQILALPKVPHEVSQALEDRDYAKAVKAIDAALAAKEGAADYLAYLKGRALFFAGKYDDSVAQFDRFAKEYPKSDWARRARFGKAVALARKGEFNAAELIYRAEVTFLLSPARKQEIADIYLEFADAYFRPKDEQKTPPDYKKALDFYQKALEDQPPGERRIEVELRVARCYQLLNQLPEAAKRFTQFIKDHTESGRGLSPFAESAQQKGTVPFSLESALVEARFRLGEVQLAQNQPQEARRTWQDMLAAHPDAKSERIAEAAYNLSLTYGIPNPGSDEDLSLGVAALQSFLKSYPGHKLAPQAWLRIAESYVNRGRYDDAVKSLTAFLAEKRYADRDELADARNLLGRSYQLQRKFPEALAAWREYLTRYPAHHAWSEVQQQIVNTEFLIAADAAEAKKYADARKLWTEFLAKYPLEPRAAQILYLFGDMNLRDAKYTEAIADWRRLVSKYPNTEESSRGQYMIAFTLETKLGQLDEALKEYRKVTWGSFTAHANVAIARLTVPTLAIATDRAFRTNETPSIRLTSRNLECVTVRAYRIDLEAYFRKMHVIQGVEGLDIALIDPDKTFEFKVPKYAEYKELESQIEVAIEGLGARGQGPEKKDAAKEPRAGAMAVTVSSKTMEATTLLLQSDLDLIVKCSRDELFVFAENMRTGEPWPGVRLLVSNGQQVFAEAVTGKDGVFKQSYKELKDAGDVRVLGLAPGGVASNIVSLQGVGVAQGLADKGYIYTDRPAYRAGQMVFVRGVLRRAVDDNYTVEKGKKFTLEVLDPRGRSLWQEDVKLSEFGSFHSQVMLPEASPVGAYRIHVYDDEGHTHEGAFEVRQYQLEPVRLTVEADRQVYYRGETIEGRIKAAFYYGAPLVGREIRYQLAGGDVKTATTDDKGEIKFKFPTRDFRESQTLPLVVQLPERNLQTEKNFFLAVQGFQFSLSTVRPVFVAGESFELTIKARDAEGKPLAQKLTLRVLEQTRVEGKIGERLVESHDLATDAKDGTIRQTLHLDKGARYILRAEGTDRFKNPVTAAKLVLVSDDRDPVRLRILADRHTFKAGETAELQIHWREVPALALVTFQGARVLDYQLVRLKTGPNKLAIPMTARLAPNFDLCVAVMTSGRDQGPVAGGQKAEVKAEPGPAPAASALRLTDAPAPRRFHEASSPFAIERPLVITLTAKRKGDAKGPIRPGEDVELAITATDPLGKPVVAELSVGMVEQALLGLFGSNVAPIDDVFRGNPRQSALQTTTTATFAYHPTTRPIDRSLLAEADRVALAAEEAEHAKLDISNLATATGGTFAVPAPATPPPAAGPTVYDPAIVDKPGSQGVQASLAESYARLATRSGSGSVNSQAMHVYGNDNAGTGANQPDFDSLTDLITATIAPNSWEATDGAGKIAPFQTNLTLTVSQSQALRGKGPGEVKPRIIIQEDEQAHLLGTLAFHDRRQSDVWFNSGGELDLSKPQQLAAHWQEQQWGVTPNLVIVADGRQSNINLVAQLGDNADRKKLGEMAEQLARSGAVLYVPRGPEETGYWNPTIVTDEHGQASLTITLPDQSTAWQLAAKGVTVDTLAGAAETEITASKELFGELKLPPAFVDGDDAQIQATVHNSLAESKEPIEVVLKTTIGDKTVEDKKTLEAGTRGMAELTFPVTVRQGARDQGPGASKGASPKRDPARDGEATFELTVSSAGRRDVVRRIVPIHPYGLPVYATAGGSASADTSVWVEAPKQMPLTAPSLQVLIGPTIEQSLLDVLFGVAPPCQLEVARISSGLDSTTSDLLAALALQKLLGTTRDATGPRAAELDARIRSAISGLVSAQRDDGGWSWTGLGGDASHRMTSARVLWSLALAKKAGYKVPDDGFQKAITWLQSQIAATGETEYESKAVLLHSLAVAGQGDFTLANRLYRNRPALSQAALAHLALALAEMDHKPMADDLLKLMAARPLGDDSAADGTGRLRLPVAHEAAIDALPWSSDPVELHALYALALEQVSPDSPKIQTEVDWLLAHRTGNRWAPDKATGPAVATLANWFARNRFDEQHYKLTVLVNNLQAAVLDVDAKTGTQTIDVPAHMLRPGKQEISLQLTGRGRYTFQAILSGFVPAEKLASTTQSWFVRRYYEPAPLEMDGKEIPRGFDVLQGSYSTFRNPLTQLPVGRRGHVELEIWRAGVPANSPEDHSPYLVLTEPIPSGATVIESSITGGFERYELGAGQITFYIGDRPNVTPIQFDVHGYLPGQYKVGPSVVRNAYRLDQMAVAEKSSAAALTVLPLGAKSADPYRLTPRELFELGKRQFDKGNFADAGPRLAELLAKWNVNADTYKQATQMLLDIHLRGGPPAEIVHYFEIIKEKWPELIFPFDKIVKIAAAYHELGEYERSYLVFRATVESSFNTEAAVPGFLEGQGEFVRSVAVMNRLLGEYPPEPYVAAAEFALSQRVYAKAAEAAGDPKLREKKIDRVDLVAQALRMLDHFMTEYPEDPAADQAAFSTCNALLELKAYKGVIARATQFAARYPQSDYLDSFWYITAYGHFALGEDKEALAMAQKVAEARRLDKKTGREVESDNKWQAIYIMGQVYHSLGEAAKAIAQYTRVEDRFADAKQAIAYFMRQEISVPEVTVVRPGDPADLELKFRNLPTADVKLYRIDLMKFSLLKRNLAGITQINLAGINPLYEATLKLGDGKDYRDRTQKLALPVKEEGAYLLVCRGADLYASGLVLVSPLAVEVQEDAPSGQVRVTVKNVVKDHYVSEVHAKVIGSRNGDFVSGDTDLRGVFVAQGIQGTSTVIAQADSGRYAFFRGQTQLGAAPEPAKPQAEAPQAAQPAANGGDNNNGLLDNVMRGNSDLQGQQKSNLKQIYQQNDGGVRGGGAF